MSPADFRLGILFRLRGFLPTCAASYRRARSIRIASALLRCCDRSL